jgi:general secretion pathway protein N
MARRIPLMGAMLLVALVLCFPLRLAAEWFGLDRLGLTAREMSGSLWNGRLSEAHLANLPVGDVRARFDPMAARLELAGADAGRGSVVFSRNGIRVSDLTGSLPLGATFAPLPVVALDLADVSAQFRGGRCETAAGSARVELDGAMLGLALAGGLGGNVRCDEGALLLPLVSQSGMEAVSLRLFEGGRYRMDVLIRQPDPASRGRLLAIGFAPRRGGYAFSVGGTL